MKERQIVMDLCTIFAHKVKIGCTLDEKQMEMQTLNKKADATREKDIYRVTVVGSVVNFLLLVFKFFAGIVGHSAAMLADAGITPDYAAGLSLGEYSALECAGVFDAKTAISLVAFRGQAMADAVQGRPCGMAAVLGMDRDALKAVCTEASDAGVVECTNFNCPGQIVISGDAAAVDKAGELAKAAGAKRVLPLKVSGPFHTSLMAPAGDALREKFQSVDFGAMEIPVLFNCLGDLKGEADTIPNLLEQQVQSSVYLEDTIRRLGELGVDTVVEIGPGRTLSGFVKKTVKGIKCYPVETAEELQAAIAALRGE